MKIEKLSENKIRVILKQEDFKNTSINIYELLLTTPNSQKLFLEILERAKEEVNFNTDGYKLLIDAYIQNDDNLVFTITKYMGTKYKNKVHRYIKVSNNKVINLNSTCQIYQFNKFEDFCEFCNYIYKNKHITLKGIYKSALLYTYNNTYYLVIDDINSMHKSFNIFNSSLLEFSIPLKNIKNFKYKLKEHGKILIKNNAINTGIKYFAHK